MTTDLKQWIALHAPTLILGGMVLIQWIALQVLVIHYHLFRKSLAKPKPDQMRFHMIEKAVGFQSEQIEGIFKKLAEFRREVASASAAREVYAAAKASAPRPLPLKRVTRVSES